MTPAAPWTADELARRALLEQGVAVAVNLRRHHNLIAWAKERGLFVRVAAPRPGGTRSCDRETVIAAYRDHYLPFKPSLLGRLGELRGKALGSWCAPLPCHADVLAAAAVGARVPQSNSFRAPGVRAEEPALLWEFNGNRRLV